MRALLVIDMQVGMLESERPPRDINSVVQHINDVARVIRTSHGLVVFIQHHGPPGDLFAPGASGWPFLPSLELSEADLVVSKTTCDAFYHTALDTLLKQYHIEELLLAGWATDFCVDTTIRAAASREYTLTVISDAHTVADRSHLSAAAIIQHHNVTWSELIVPGRPIRVVTAEALVRQLTDTHTAQGA